MKKKVLLFLSGLLVPGAGFAGDDMTGMWQCTMMSDYGDFEFVLALNADGTYANKENSFGEISVSRGTWTMFGDELVMQREKYTTNGEEKASTQVFRRNVVSVSESAMEMEHDDIKTVCKRA